MVVVVVILKITATRHQDGGRGCAQHHVKPSFSGSFNYGLHVLIGDLKGMDSVFNVWFVLTNLSASLGAIGGFGFDPRGSG